MRRTQSYLTHAAILALSALPGLGACSSATHFYTLSKIAGPVAAAGTPADTAVVVALGPVSLPAYVDRPQIIIRENAYSVRLSLFDQWAGNLDDMVPRILMEDLAQRLPGGRVVPFPTLGTPSFDYRIALTITQLDVSTAGEAVVAAAWQVHGRAGDAPLLATDTTARAQAASASYEDRVAALSQALGTLSDDLARAVTTLPRTAARS
jgi:uncharacterized lipoprotein YmbA